MDQIVSETTFFFHYHQHKGLQIFQTFDKKIRLSQIIRCPFNVAGGWLHRGFSYSTITSMSFFLCMPQKILALNIHLIVYSSKKGQSVKIISLKDLPWEDFFPQIANKADFSSLLALNYKSTIRLTTEHIKWDYYYWLQLIMIQPLGLCRTLFSLRTRCLCLSGVKWNSTCPVTK